MEENRNLLQQLRQRASPRPRRKQPQYGKFDAPPNIKVCVLVCVVACVVVWVDKVLWVDCVCGCV